MRALLIGGLVVAVLVVSTVELELPLVLVLVVVSVGTGFGVVRNVLIDDDDDVKEQCGEE